MATPNIYHRMFPSCVMLLAFALCILLGNFGMVALVLAIECKAFQELRNIRFGLFTRHALFTDWLLFLTCGAWAINNSLCCCRPHHMTAFLCYTLWFAKSVWSFDKDMVYGQLARFFWIHIAVIFTSLQLFFLISNIQRGMIWFLFPSILVICNDIAAYVCGKMLGHTPLYALSPSKTVEGFIGAAVVTMTVGYCSTKMILPSFFSTEMQQMQRKDALLLSLYASFVAPFGGFLASALKRACDIKDFGNWIPGHGGIVDRMDCQLLMGAFTFIYIRGEQSQSSQ